MRVKGIKEPYLNFVRELVIEMLMVHGTAPIRRYSLNGLTSETVRYDGLNHWIVSVEEDATGKAKRRNCRHCYIKEKKELKTVTQCEKCKVPLHTGCFKEEFIIIWEFNIFLIFLLCMFLFIKRFLCSNFFSNTISIFLLKLGKTEKIIKVQELAEIFSISVFFILIFVIANIFSKATFFSEYYNLYTKTWEKQKKKIK